MTDLLTRLKNPEDAAELIDSASEAFDAIKADRKALKELRDLVAVKDDEVSAMATELREWKDAHAQYDGYLASVVGERDRFRAALLEIQKGRVPDDVAAGPKKVDIATVARLVALAQKAIRG